MTHRQRLLGVAAALLMASVAVPAFAGSLDDVTAATTSSLRSAFKWRTVQVRYASVAQSWAYMIWTAGEAGGDSLMQRVGNRWKVVSQGHGAMDPALMHAFGVPPMTAVALYSGRCSAPQKTRVNLKRTMLLLVRRVDTRGHRADSASRCTL